MLTLHAVGIAVVFMSFLVIEVGNSWSILGAHIPGSRPHTIMPFYSIGCQIRTQGRDPRQSVSRPRDRGRRIPRLVVRLPAQSFLYASRSLTSTRRSCYRGSKSMARYCELDGKTGTILDDEVRGWVPLTQTGMQDVRGRYILYMQLLCRQVLIRSQSPRDKEVYALCFGKIRLASTTTMLLGINVYTSASPFRESCLRPKRVSSAAR